MVGPLDVVLAPPYDVVTPDKRDELVRKNPLNIFSLEMPVLEEGERGDPLRDARRRLEGWIKERILIKDKIPSVYPYEIEFELFGRYLVRTGLIALIRLEEWGKGIVIPHEKTFKEVTEERLGLLKAVKAQFSQIFLLSKAEKVVRDVAKGGKRDLLLEAKDERGNIHRIYRLNEPSCLRKLREGLKGKRLYIADGHHRYTTALNFKRLGDENNTFKAITPPPHHFIMAYIVDSEDPGLVTLPTYRIAKAGNVDSDFMDRLAPYFRKLADFPFDKDPTYIEKRLKDLRPGAGFVIVPGYRRQCSLFCLEPSGRETLVEKGIRDELASLDVTAVDELAIPILFGMGPGTLKERGKLRYEADRKKALDLLREDEVLFFLRPAGVNEILKVADSGLTMSHKATFFYPKILTGTVIRLLGDGQDL